MLWSATRSPCLGKDGQTLDLMAFSKGIDLMVRIVEARGWDPLRSEAVEGVLLPLPAYLRADAERRRAREKQGEQPEDHRRTWQRRRRTVRRRRREQVRRGAIGGGGRKQSGCGSRLREQGGGGVVWRTDARLSDLRHRDSLPGPPL